MTANQTTDRRYDNTDRNATACNWCGASESPYDIDDSGLCVGCVDQPAERAELFATWRDLDAT